MHREHRDPHPGPPPCAFRRRFGGGGTSARFPQDGAHRAGVEADQSQREGTRYKEADTEEEEEQQAAEREKRWKETREGASKAELAKLKILNTKMCNWSDEEWESLQKAYARTCKK